MISYTRGTYYITGFLLNLTVGWDAGKVSCGREKGRGEASGHGFLPEEVSLVWGSWQPGGIGKGFGA